MRGRLLLSSTVFGVALVSGGWFVQRGITPRESAVARTRLLDDVMAKVRDAYVDPLADSIIYRHTVEGMLKQLRDPHSTYLSPERLQRLMERTQANYAGIGLSVDIRDGWPTVLSIFPGSPAERSGVEIGDRIVEVKGQGTRGWTVDETVRAVRGAPGTTVAIAIERPGMASRIPLTVAREAIHVRAVRRTIMLPGSIGYLDVNEFSEVVTAELAAAVDSLVKQGMTGLVLDLRGNPGGLLDQGVAVADLFLDPGQAIVTVRARGAEGTRVFADEKVQPWPTLPIVVLVNGGSASASEIVAGALQDHDRAVIVGSPSFGKGSAQSVFPLTTGGALKLTTARWFTPSGRSISKASRLPRDEASDDPDVAADDTVARFRTDAQRKVRGGGGILPDVIVGDTAEPPAERALQRALGGQVATFRDAIADFAATLKATHGLTSPDFAVTDAMRDQLYARMRARGLTVDRIVYDSARTVVGELLGAEAARYSFGVDAMFRRRMNSDPVLQRATLLLAGVRAPKQLLERATSGS